MSMRNNSKVLSGSESSSSQIRWSDLTSVNSWIVHSSLESTSVGLWCSWSGGCGSCFAFTDWSVGGAGDCILNKDIYFLISFRSPGQKKVKYWEDTHSHHHKRFRSDQLRKCSECCIQHLHHRRYHRSLVSRKTKQETRQSDVIFDRESIKKIGRIVFYSPQ